MIRTGYPDLLVQVVQVQRLGRVRRETIVVSTAAVLGARTRRVVGDRLGARRAGFRFHIVVDDATTVQRLVADHSSNSPGGGNIWTRLFRLLSRSIALHLSISR